jgi:hypothetical protein
MANANVNLFTEAKVDPRNPDRGPLLIIEGKKDHTVPWAIAHAAYKRQKHNESVTEITRIPEPRALAHDRQRLARGCTDGTRLREAIRLVALSRDLDSRPVRSITPALNDEGAWRAIKRRFPAAASGVKP